MRNENDVHIDGDKARLNSGGTTYANGCRMYVLFVIVVFLLQGALSCQSKRKEFGLHFNSNLRAESGVIHRASFNFNVLVLLATIAAV